MEVITAIVPIVLITSTVQVIKQIFNLSPSAIKGIAFCLAILFGVLTYVKADFTQAIVNILTYALSAIGFWEVAGPSYKKIVGIDEIQK